MTFLRKSPTILVTLLCWQAAAAGEPPTIDRTLRREPAYATKPQYCLLLFGPEAKFHVWLVTAGEAFYADRNGDGDLTEPGKRIYSVGNFRALYFSDPGMPFMYLPAPENERIYQVGDVFDAASRTWLNVTMRRSGTLKSAVFEIMVDVRGKFHQLGKLPRFGDHPQDAPILHFNGPLTVGLFPSRLVRRRAGNELAAWVGTNVPAGASGEPTRVVHDDAIPSYVFPIASIEFPGDEQTGRHIYTTVPLNRRDGLVRFSGSVQVPEQAGRGSARMRLSAPNWRTGEVTAATVKIPIVEVEVLPKKPSTEK
jgi:hypothetical protein